MTLAELSFESDSDDEDAEAQEAERDEENEDYEEYEEEDEQNGEVLQHESHFSFNNNHDTLSAQSERPSRPPDDGYALQALHCRTLFPPGTFLDLHRHKMHPCRKSSHRSTSRHLALALGLKLRAKARVFRLA